MVNYIALRDALLKSVEEQGLEITTKSGLSSLNRVIKLTDMVRVVMRTAGIPESELEAVMLNSVSNLAHAWHTYDGDAKAIVDRYMKKGRQERGEADPEPRDQGERQGQGEGQGPDQGQEQGEGQGEGEPTPQPSEGQGEEQGQGQGQGEPAPGADGEQGEGQGQGEGEGEGEGQGEMPIPEPSEDQGEGEPTPAPIPPEDMPNDPDYIPPSIWSKVVAIIKWNLTHPGKQKNIMLVGPRGVGKTEMVFQIAKKFYASIPHAITSPQADHKLTGYGDAQGREVKSQFSDGYVQPGIVLIEEMDRSEASPLISINMATANKYMDVPIRGMIQQHPLCTIMATANTAGTGATDEYVTANQLDASTRDRWIYILMDWEHDIAVRIAKGDDALVYGLEDWNQSCEKNGYISGTASYRAITDIHDLLDMGFSFKDAIKSGMLKYAIPKSNMMTILDSMEKKGTEFYRVLTSIMEELPEIETGMA